ncbi:MAG: hypothetical protein M1833_005417 [Piccolia ochrophora]|nr:MAG: hypothetical protein M1833_005417 [Piccolia ochrophora]
MAKGKRRKLTGPSSSRHSKPGALQKPKSSKSAHGSKAKQPRHSPTIPFSPTDRILLVGEGPPLLCPLCYPNRQSANLLPAPGDFSFSTSLHTHHHCTSLTATTLESSASLATKHPSAASHIATLEAGGQRVCYEVDAGRLERRKEIRLEKERRGGWERVVWNFPHTGGKSTDVNRQVRGNQELLVHFLTSARPLLAPHGTIVLTIFTGAPYDLWNVRDLARHVGLSVQRSFAFDAAAYPGYKHARTFGEVEGGGGWRGEERNARTFVFESGEAGRVGTQKKGAKRKRGEGRESEDVSDEENDTQ